MTYKRLLIVAALSVTGCLTGCKNLLPMPLGGINTTAQSDGVIRLLIAGQSNGESPSNSSIACNESVTGHVRVTDPGSDDLYTPSASRAPCKNVAWVFLGDMLYAQYHKPVEIYNAACANTSTLQWKASLYMRVINELKRHRFDAVLWVQGESDYETAVPTDASYSSLAWVIQQARGNQATPWIVALDSSMTELNKPWLGTSDRVLNAQRRVIHDGYALQGPDLMPLHEESYTYDFNGGEFLKESLHDHAQLWFDVLNRYRPWDD